MNPRILEPYLTKDMFTGIIQGLGVVKGIEKRGESGRITIQVQDSRFKIQGPTLHFSVGDSIAVDGVCLTVVEVQANSFSCDLSEETIKSTTLGGMKRGTKVNLEKALRASDHIGGHIVTGHVDGTGVITKKTARGDFSIMEFDIPKGLIKQVVKRGSIAIDGISLTVVEVWEGGIRVHLIPHTLKVTNLSVKGVGDRVNVETDIIGKYVERFLVGYKGIDEGFLRRTGCL